MASRSSQVRVTQAEIYADRNPLRSGRRKRTKESTAAVRHLRLDLDTDREARLTALRVSDALPTPITFISPLRGRPTDQWRVEGFLTEPQVAALKPLAIAIGSDATSADCNRVLRINIPTANAMLLPCSIPSQKHPGRHANSDHDWARLRLTPAHGKDARELCRRWLRVAPIYPVLFCYAQRTVDVAIGHTLAEGGIPMDDVAKVLEVCHRFEILQHSECEITLAAHKVIARRRTVDSVTYIRRSSATTRDQSEPRHQCFFSAGRAYCSTVCSVRRFIRASADDVVDKALKYVFSNDPDLADFLKTPQTKQSDSILRICKGASKDAVEHPVSIRDGG